MGGRGVDGASPVVHTGDMNWPVLGVELLETEEAPAESKPPATSLWMSVETDSAMQCSDAVIMQVSSGDAMKTQQQVQYAWAGESCTAASIRSNNNNVGRWTISPEEETEVEGLQANGMAMLNGNSVTHVCEDEATKHLSSLQSRQMKQRNRAEHWRLHEEVTWRGRRSKQSNPMSHVAGTTRGPPLRRVRVGSHSDEAHAMQKDSDLNKENKNNSNENENDESYNNDNNINNGVPHSKCLVQMTNRWLGQYPGEGIQYEEEEGIPSLW